MGKYSSGLVSAFLGISGRAAGVGDTAAWARHALDLTRSPERRGMTKQQPTAPITPDRDIQELENTPIRYLSRIILFKKYPIYLF